MPKLSEPTVSDGEKHNQPQLARDANMTPDGNKTAMVEADKTRCENYLDGVSFDYFYQLLSDHIGDEEPSEFMSRFDRDGEI